MRAGRAPRIRLPRLRWSVGRQVALPGLVGLLAVAVVAITGVVAISDAAAANRRATALAGAMRHHLEGDQMHDALRADVLTIMNFDDRSARLTAAEQASQHVAVLEASFEANAELLASDAELSALYEETGYALAAYTGQAVAFLEEGVDDQEFIQQRMYAFFGLYTQLESGLQLISDRLEAIAGSAATDAAAPVGLAPPSGS